MSHQNQRFHQCMLIYSPGLFTDISRMTQTEQMPRPNAELSTADKLRSLLDITKKISRSLDLDEVLNLVMDTLASLIPYDAAGIYLIETGDESPYIFKSRAIRGYEISFALVEPQLRLGEGLIGAVAQS